MAQRFISVWDCETIVMLDVTNAKATEGMWMKVALHVDGEHEGGIPI